MQKHKARVYAYIEAHAKWSCEFIFRNQAKNLPGTPFTGSNIFENLEFHIIK